MSALKVYLAGPMTGIRSFNIPAFDKLARELRACGINVVSPAELDDPRIRAISLASEDGAMATIESHGMTHGDFLSRDVKLLSDDGIEAVVVLPGWQKSRGAQIETAVAHIVKRMPILEVASITQEDPVDQPKVTWRRIPMRQLVSAWAGVNVADLIYGDS